MEEVVSCIREGRLVPEHVVETWTLACHSRAVYIGSKMMLDVVMPVWRKYAAAGASNRHRFNEYKDLRQFYQAVADSGGPKLQPREQEIGLSATQLLRVLGAPVLHHKEAAASEDALLRHFAELTAQLISDIEYLAVGVEFGDAMAPTGALGFFVHRTQHRLESVNLMSALVDEQLLTDIQNCVSWLSHFVLRKRCTPFEILPHKKLALSPLQANAVFMHYVGLRIVERRSRENAGRAVLDPGAVEAFATIIETQLVS